MVSGRFDIGALAAVFGVALAVAFLAFITVVG